MVCEPDIEQMFQQTEHLATHQLPVTGQALAAGRGGNQRR
jgi:hypothetical protein